MSSLEGSSANPTRQKLDALDTQSMSPGLRSTSTPTQPRMLSSPKTDLPQRSTTPKDVPKPSPHSAREDGPPTQLPQPVMPPPRESGEMTPRTPLPVATPVSSPSMATLGWGSAPPPPSPVTLSGSAPAPAIEIAPVPVPVSVSPTAPAASPIPPSPDPSSSTGDVQLMRQLLDTRHALAMGQRREQALLDQLERLGAPPAEIYRGGGGHGDGGGGGNGDRSGAEAALRDEVSRLENEVKAERARRMRAERALSDVERECRTPFIVPALYQAFISISELSN
ncbi:hypothetical protein JVU11DRAFT_8515 [Chiua virens]|nr:hypothetical protein JVU11DRAFT_8515 [Chiua virens]